MFKKIIISLIGVYFILSGVSKMFPIEHFELQVYGLGLPWLFSVWVSRLVIGMEILIGLGMIWPFHFKKALRFCIVVLLAFSGFLLYQIIIGKGGEDCGCFGTWLSMNSYWALARNVFFILLLFWGRHGAETPKSNLKKWIFGGFFVAAFAVIFTLNPPDYLMGFGQDNTLHPEEFPIEELPEMKHESGGLSTIPEKGKKIVAFFSLSCPHCKKSNTKLHLLSQRSHIEIPIFIVFMGENTDPGKFWEQTGSDAFPYTFLPAKKFLPLSGPNLPAIFLLENTHVKSKMGYRDFDPDMVLRFFIED